MIRAEGNDLLLADLTSVLDHLLNEGSHFFQEHLVAVDDLEELALLQDVVVELLQTVLEVLVQAVNAGRIEGTPLLLVPDVFVEKASSCISSPKKKPEGVGGTLGFPNTRQ